MTGSHKTHCMHTGHFFTLSDGWERTSGSGGVPSLPSSPSGGGHAGSQCEQALIGSQRDRDELEEEITVLSRAQVLGEHPTAKHHRCASGEFCSMEIGEVHLEGDHHHHQWDHRCQHESAPSWAGGCSGHPDPGCRRSFPSPAPVLPVGTQRAAGAERPCPRRPCRSRASVQTCPEPVTHQRRHPLPGKSPRELPAAAPSQAEAKS